MSGYYRYCNYCYYFRLFASSQVLLWRLLNLDIGCYLRAVYLLLCNVNSDTSNSYSLQTNNSLGSKLIASGQPYRELELEPRLKDGLAALVVSVIIIVIVRCCRRCRCCLLIQSNPSLTTTTGFGYTFRHTDRQHVLIRAEHAESRLSETDITTCCWRCCRRC